MGSSIRLTIAAALTLSLAASGQNTAPLSDPATAAANVSPEMKAWMAKVNAQWQAAFEQEVTAPHEAAKAKLNQQYLAVLDSNIAKASQAGDLDLTAAWRDERTRFAASHDAPLEDRASDPDALKQLRAGWRAQTAQLDKERADHAKAMYARYDQVLAQAQTQADPNKHVGDALLLKSKRDEIAAAWPPNAFATTAPIPAAPTANKSPIGQQSARTMKAVIPANSPDAFPIGDARKGTKITFTYVKGKWKSFGRIATENPDVTASERGDTCRLVIALPSHDGHDGKIIAVVPPETQSHPFVFEAEADYAGLVLRINDADNSYDQNPGSVEYQVKIVPPTF